MTVCQQMPITAFMQNKHKKQQVQKTKVVAATTLEFENRPKL
jgi:hypothetical protein